LEVFFSYVQITEVLKFVVASLLAEINVMQHRFVIVV